MSMQESPQQPDRLVDYVVQEGSYDTGDFKWSAESVKSTGIPDIPDRELRLALELADIVQTLGFPNPEMGGFPGGVTAIVGSKIISPADEYFHVRTDFPDDTITRLKQWLHENH